MHFLAAVERTLSLAFRNQDGAWEGHDDTVTVVAERDGLNDADVVVDFRTLEADLDRALALMRGPSAQEPDLDGPLDAAKRIAEAIAPSIAPPARLAYVSLQDGAGRRVTLEQLNFQSVRVW
jgi:hypothetical protein